MIIKSYQISTNKICNLRLVQLEAALLHSLLHSCLASSNLSSAPAGSPYLTPRSGYPWSCQAGFHLAQWTLSTFIEYQSFKFG